MSKTSRGSKEMWEGSRIILPEHRNALEKYHDEKKKQKRPELDEQQLHEFNYLIQRSLQEEQTLKFTIFGEYENREEIGIIKKIDMHQNRVQIKKEDDSEWINLKDIINITL